MKRIILFLRLSVVMFFVLLMLLASPIGSFSQTEVEKNSKLDIQNHFVASGFMGDGEYGRKYIEFEGAYEKDPYSQPFCIKIKYTFGPKRWAGIYWQNKPDNWGDKPGNNYSKEGFTDVTFWAKGENGNEVVEFKAGDIYNETKKYHDSFGSTIGRLILSKNWEKYQITIKDLDLSSVIGAFCWVASKDYNNQNTIVFFIDDIYFE